MERAWAAAICRPSDIFGAAFEGEVWACMGEAVEYVQPQVYKRDVCMYVWLDDAPVLVRLCF